MVFGGKQEMATQRPGGARSTSAPTKATTKATTTPTTKPTTTSNTRATATGTTATPRQTPPRKESTQLRDLGADTTIWHTRGLQTNSRLRMPLVQRTPQRQLPPSPLPRLMLWAVLIGTALVCFQAVKHLLW